MTDQKRPVSESDIVNLLHEFDDEPQTFEALMETWNAFFDLSQRSGERTFSEVEEAALTSSASMHDHQPTSGIGRQVGYLLEQFSSPAFLVRENGRVLAQNTAALHAFEIGPENTLDDLPLDLERGDQIADIVSATLNPQRNIHEAVLRRAYAQKDNSAVTLSIAPSKLIKNGSGEALVFVVDARWKTAAAGLIKREFDLTDSERALLVAFLDGQSTKDMAKSRNRSHATVRTQFHSLMTKMGARNQTELFRNALSISQFVDKVDAIAEVLRHPHRKRVDLVRPGGRSVEVTMCGDLTGKPLVHLQSSYAYTFEPKIEQAFFEAGFCVLSICRPGYGDTDPAPEGQSIYEVFAGDLNALLDQLGFEKCMLLASNTGSAFMHYAASLVADRVSGLIQVAACAPMAYQREDDISVPWVKGIYRTGRTHPGMMDFLFRTETRAWCTMGQARFLNLQFRNDPQELKNVLRPEALKESNHALNVSTKQGVGYAVADFKLAFTDYRDEVAKADLPMLMMQGTRDQVFGLGPVRRFAEDFSERTTFVALVDGAFSAMETHTDEIIAQMLAFYESYLTRVKH